MTEPRVIIIGAGITGLLLAQSLKSHNIAFDIYERDLGADSRGQGWGLAIHWALDTLRSLLPNDLRERLPETYVDPSLKQGEGKFPLHRLDNGEVLFTNLSPKRVRVSRERFRALLMSGLEIKWGKELEKIVQSEELDIRVEFADGSFANGTFLAGCDGTRSKVREILCSFNGTNSRNNTLPVRFLGSSVVLNSEVAQLLRDLDPLFFQGSHPNNSFMFFGIQDTPANNGREEQDSYRCQVNVSWPYRKGFLGESEPIEIPVTDREKVSLLRKISATWTSPFRDAVESITEGSLLQAIKIEDRDPSAEPWDNLGGRATLVGDAAHPMTMYRGEACNHNIKDVEGFIEAVMEHKLDFRKACISYEKKMIDRTSLAVLASRQACLHAHEHEKIDGESPLISKRAIVPGGAVHTTESLIV